MQMNVKYILDNIVAFILDVENCTPHYAESITALKNEIDVHNKEKNYALRQKKAELDLCVQKFEQDLFEAKKAKEAYAISLYRKYDNGIEDLQNEIDICLFTFDENYENTSLTLQNCWLIFANSLMDFKARHQKLTDDARNNHDVDVLKHNHNYNIMRINGEVGSVTASYEKRINETRQKAIKMMQDYTEKYQPAVDLAKYICSNDTAIDKTLHHKEAVIIGFYRLKMLREELLVPIGFDRHSTLSLVVYRNESYDNENEFSFMLTSYLCRIILSHNCADIKISFIDPLKSGQYFTDIFSFVNECPELFDSKMDCYTGSKITEAVVKIQEELFERRRLINTDSFFNYNKNKSKKMPLRVFVINCYSKVFENNFDVLKSLFEFGVQYGLCVVLLDVASSSFSPEKHNKSHERIIDILKWGESQNSICVDASVTLHLPRFRNFNPENMFYRNETPVNILKQAIIDEYRNNAEKQEEAVATKNTIDNSIEDFTYSSGTSDGLSLPIGIFDETGNKAELIFTRENAHALFGGSTGMGKSTLYLHMIIGAMRKYSPEEFLVYVFDLKNGVTFQIFADYILPCVAGVVRSENPIDCLMVLEKLDEEMTHRGKLFDKNRVSDITEYRKNEKLPKILLLIDEFPRILSPNKRENNDARNLLLKIINQGSGFGIHALLCAQNVTMGTGLSKEMLNELKIRILINSNPQTIQTMLSTEDRSALIEVEKTIRSLPKGGGILNCERGDIEDNNSFTFSDVNSIAKESLNDISNYWKGLGYSKKVKILGGEQPNFSILVSNAKEGLLSGGSNRHIQIGEYFSLSKPEVLVEFDGIKNSNILISTTSPAKADSVVQSYMLSLISTGEKLCFVDFLGTAEKTCEISNYENVQYIKAVSEDERGGLVEFIEQNTTIIKHFVFYGLHRYNAIWDATSPQEPAKTIKAKITGLL